MSGQNAPDRHARFVLGEGEMKVAIEEDPRVPNAATVIIKKEDHTIGNMLRGQLLHIPYVVFAGYRVPHPLQADVVLRIQVDGKDSSQTPTTALQTATRELILILAAARLQFEASCKSFTERQELGLGADGADLGGAYGDFAQAGGFAQ
ncbi:uncharacterized protein L969DRAFT_86775 [Mixia osmundae IAM 14324]|uniref:DNA-directed RNA polymerase RBP11-like dimerisation domain-containing protein n=1 Tax=Mixia osmundae (strain CBS 9802 / IAM 14324 / JCM 22182 / KY 12970) TaxID=764103 RepID=G7E8P4_MIXOS|nr:uncharacterized protein L969DRAFT_86775 [Mixia osmundae IAM 14324]KEI40148.1 hypothetical protein L969DRAFT_86775 [Mixia osmundae IAM 14324]GAA99512.1 hypothetical protein E5Q_06213 [Mixia osmundae IAM 14324]